MYVLSDGSVANSRLNRMRARRISRKQHLNTQPQKTGKSKQGEISVQGIATTSHSQTAKLPSNI